LTSTIKRDVDLSERIHFSTGAASPFSRDFGPPDFYLFGTIKRKLIERNFQGTGDLVEGISDVTSSIRPTELDGLLRNWEDRLRRCIEMNGEYVD
jgi:hypothetical protein